VREHGAEVLGRGDEAEGSRVRERDGVDEGFAPRRVVGRGAAKVDVRNVGLLLPARVAHGLVQLPVRLRVAAGQPCRGRSELARQRTFWCSIEQYLQGLDVSACGPWRACRMATHATAWQAVQNSKLATVLWQWAHSTALFATSAGSACQLGSWQRGDVGEGTHELMRTGPTFGATGAVDGCTRWPLELINRGRRAAGPGEGMRGGGRTEGARASGLAATRGARGRTRTNGRFSFALLLPAPLCQLLLSLPVTRYPRPRDSRGEAIRGSSLQVPECNASLAVRSPQYIHLAGDASYFDDVETLQPRRTGQPGAQCSTRRPAQSIRRQPRARRGALRHRRRHKGPHGSQA